MKRNRQSDCKNLKAKQRQLIKTNRKIKSELHKPKQNIWSEQLHEWVDCFGGCCFNVSETQLNYSILKNKKSCVIFSS